MKKPDFKSLDLLGIGVTVVSCVLGIMKMKNDANKEEAKKAEIIKEVMDKIKSEQD